MVKRATALVYRTQRTKSPPLRIAQQYQRNLYIAKKYFQCATIPSLTVRVYIRLAVVAFQTCQLAQNSEKNWTYSSSRTSKVDDFGTNRKRIYDFLLVINSNFGPILHRVWDTATYYLKIAYFAYPLCHLASPLPIFPLEFHGEVKRQETRVMELLCGDGCVILTSTIFDWSTRMADGQTDGRAMAYRAL